MLYQTFAYLKWIPKTFHLHGIHSPFIFSLEKDVLRAYNPNEISKELIAYRRGLLDSEEIIKVTDYGAGSRVFSSKQRPVKKIATIAGANYKRMLLLQRLFAHFKPEKSLELGTSLGLATAAMAINNTGTIATIEGCPNTAAVAQKNLHIFSNIELHIGEFTHEIKKLGHKRFDFIYFDGNHSKEATLEYVHQLLPTHSDNTVWFFDDIHWSAEMTSAWDTIKVMPEVSASIDCFWFGVIFFRPGQAKEDFYIKL